MASKYRRRYIPYGELARWLAIFLPIGLFYLWRVRNRCHWTVKILISVTAAAFTLCVWIGALSMFSRPNPVMAQSPATALLQQESLYPLYVDADGSRYHLEGCRHIKPDSVPILLNQAARQGIPADELCNPPRYDSRN